MITFINDGDDRLGRSGISDVNGPDISDIDIIGIERIKMR